MHANDMHVQVYSGCSNEELIDIAMSLRSLEAVTLCLLTRFATFSKSFQVRTFGPKLAPLKMPHSTSTIIAKPYPLYPPVTRIMVFFPNNYDFVHVKCKKYK